MVDNRAGRVAYAALSFREFLTMGSVPQSALRYSERLDASELNVTIDHLKNAPPVTTHVFDTGVANLSGKMASVGTIRATPYWLAGKSFENPLRAAVSPVPCFSKRLRAFMIERVR